MEKALHVKEITFRVKPCMLLFGLEFGLVYHTSPITCQAHLKSVNIHNQSLLLSLTYLHHKLVR